MPLTEGQLERFYEGGNSIVLGFPECTGIGMWTSEKEQKGTIGNGSCMSKGMEVRNFQVCWRNGKLSYFQESVSCTNGTTGDKGER